MKAQFFVPCLVVPHPNLLVLHVCPLHVFDSHPRLSSTHEGTKVKLAVTFFAAFMVTIHDPVPEQSPDHPVKVLPGIEFGVAVSVITEP